jgi:hypothetical protein
MTQEDKQLLLKDTCARLPYHPKAKMFIEGFGREYDEQWVDIELGHAWFESETENIKLFLRPMSSMTEEEIEEYNTIDYNSGTGYYTYPVIDWLNAHHFDYRGLIEKSLALEAPEGMYNIE